MNHVAMKAAAWRKKASRPRPPPPRYATLKSFRLYVDRDHHQPFILHSSHKFLLHSYE